MKNYAIIDEGYYAGVVQLDPLEAAGNPRYTSKMPEGLLVNPDSCPLWQKDKWVNDQSPKAKIASAKHHGLPAFLLKND